MDMPTGEGKPGIGGRSLSQQEKTEWKPTGKRNLGVGGMSIQGPQDTGTSGGD